MAEALFEVPRPRAKGPNRGLFGRALRIFNALAPRRPCETALVRDARDL